MNILIDVMKTTLTELAAGLRGDLSMSEQMERLMNELYLAKIPSIWEKESYPSLKKLGPWMDDLEKRVK